MSLKIVRTKSLPIGVDMGTSTLKMVQLYMDAKVPTLLAAGSALIPADCRDDFMKRLDFTMRSIRQILKDSAFQGRQSILSLPAEATFVHHVKIPRNTPVTIAQAVANELRGKLPYPPEKAVIRHIVAGEVPGEGEVKREVIAICAERKQLEAYLEMALKAKLDVIGVNVEPCAIVECFSRLFRRDSDTSRAILFVDIGWRSTQVVVSHGSRIVFARNLKRGGQEFDNVTAEGMGISLDEVRDLRRQACHQDGKIDKADELYACLDPVLDCMSEELTQCLRYYESVFRRRDVERVIFVGGQACDKRLCQTLAKRLNLPAQIGDPMVGIKPSTNPGSATPVDCSRPQPNWAVAIGLSLGAQAA